LPFSQGHTVDDGVDLAIRFPKDNIGETLRN
jgi:hypothetical protein